MFISQAHAAAGSAGGAAQGGSPWFSILTLVAFAAIFYFMLIRPQNKRTKDHKSMIDALQKGDEIVTNGGLVGKVTKLDDHLAIIKVSENTEVMVQRGMIASTLPKGTIKSLKS